MPGPAAFRPFFFFRVFLPLFLVGCCCYCLNAQLCTGSLGDPIVNITFGSGSGPSSYTPSNSYTYTNSSCPDDGFYTIARTTSNCFGDTWHTVSSDHTGNGSFMLVNASYTPGDFFLTSVTDLCPNTTYEFAAWIVNVMNRPGIDPNITFKIETPGGIVLKEFQTGDISETAQPEWKQYGFFFTTPPDNATIVLRMVNNAPGGGGNDVGLDDITFRPCGETIETSVTGAADTINVCEGNTDAYTFTADVSSNYISPVYQWQLSMDSGATWKDIPGATGASYTRNQTASPGNYWYRMTVVEATYAGLISCRIASDAVVINVHPKPKVNAGPDRIIITGNAVTLAANAAGDNLAIAWAPDLFINDINTLTPTVSPPTDMIYTLSAVSASGCANEDNAKVKVVAGIFVPTAFTPNNDGKNDTWEIPFLDPGLEATVSVFNRYGQRVYHCVNAIVNWDGTLNGMAQAAGTYVYMVISKTNNLKLNGTVTLIR